MSPKVHTGKYKSTPSNVLEEHVHGHTHTRMHKHTQTYSTCLAFSYISPECMKKHLLPCLMREVKRDSRKHRGVHRTEAKHEK